ncbi:MAG: hypothetical protein HYU66_12170, partial [Armatimonadetes bacterium]|nr:hypothetical protein [Armatimonadota bacterium]
MRAIPLALLLALLLALATQASALTADRARDQAFSRLWDRDPPGDLLFSEDFEGGNLDRWNPDPGWTLVDRPGGPGECAQVVSTEDQIQDLVLKAPLTIVPGHPVAVCWRTRLTTGSQPLFLRVDFFGEDGKQGAPYARQELSRSGPEWTDNVMLVSDWFPDYARAITIWFHEAEKAGTTSLLDDIRVVDLQPAVTALLQAELPALRARAGQLATALGKLPASPVIDAWKTVAAKRLAWIREQLDAAAKLEPGSGDAARVLAEPSVYLQRLGDAVAALGQKKLSTTRVLAYATRPISSTMILPHTAELPGGPAERVTLAACPGEYEPASLVLWSPDGLPAVGATASDLKGPAGSIPAANLDLKWVKCWYQGGNAPYGIGVVRDRKALIPELLVNDPDLVRVDLAAQHNELKLSFPAGARYVPIDDPQPVNWGGRLKLDEFPVKDSPTLLPADLPAGLNQQLWLTLKVPDSAKAGRYEGRLQLMSEGRPVGSVALAVDVLPFALAEPRTHHDPAAEFTYSLYYWGWLDPAGQGSISYDRKSEPQFRAELRYMRERGIVAPCMIWPAPMVYGDETAFRRHLQLAKEEGFAGHPLVFGS